jgi:hypothetical protein
MTKDLEHVFPACAGVIPKPIPMGKAASVNFVLNVDAFKGKSLGEIDTRIANSRTTVAQSLEEAVWHEIEHVKLIKGLSLTEIEALYKELAPLGLEGISKSALADGDEAIAEIGVLLRRGEEISLEAKNLYEKYARR